MSERKVGEPGPRRKEVGSAALDLPSFKRGFYAVGSNKLTTHIEPRSAHIRIYTFLETTCGHSIVMEFHVLISMRKKKKGNRRGLQGERSLLAWKTPEHSE